MIEVLNQKRKIMGYVNGKEYLNKKKKLRGYLEENKVKDKTGYATHLFTVCMDIF